MNKTQYSNLRAKYELSPEDLDLLEGMGFDWINTEIPPSLSLYQLTYGTSGRGWKLHLVGKDSRESLCGIWPRYGWGGDIFLEDKCLRCIKSARKLLTNT